MIFSDVFYRRFEYDAVDRREIYVGSRHEYDKVAMQHGRRRFMIIVRFHNTLSSEIKKVRNLFDSVRRGERLAAAVRLNLVLE